MVTPEAEVLVRRVFLLALDQPKAQVETLPQVATVLQRPDLIAQWIEAPDTAAALAALRQGPGSWQS